MRISLFKLLEVLGPRQRIDVRHYASDGHEVIDYQGVKENCPFMRVGVDHIYPRPNQTLIIWWWDKWQV